MCFSFHCSSNCFRLVSLIFIILMTCAFGNENTFDPLSNQCYDRLEERIKQSDDTLLESYEFLKAFIKQVNSKYNLSLTMLDAANLVEKNIDQYNFSNETKISLLRLIEFIQSFESNIPLASSFANLLGPFEWVWNWIFDKQEKKSETEIQFIIAPVMQIGLTYNEDQIAIGLVEIFAGALLCVIPHPISYSVGSGLILDGSRRLFDGAAEESRAF